MMIGCESREVRRWLPEKTETELHGLVEEAPLSISVQGIPQYVGMRTPGNEPALAAGFCLAEGIVAFPEDLRAVDYPEPGNPDHVNVTLAPERWEKVRSVCEKRAEAPIRGFGRNAEETVAALIQDLPPLPFGVKVSVRRGYSCLDDLHRHQPLRKKTKATHATAVYTTDFELLTAAEDVGRHNGMDKAIGRLFLDGELSRAGVLVLSSRVSFELVQKAIRAKIPSIFSVSRPTALAVHLASRMNISIASLAREGGGYIYCGQERLTV